jgi:hypothetical protein
MVQVSFAVPHEVRKALKRFHQVNWDGVVTRLLWEYTKRLQLADRLAQSSRLTPVDVTVLDRQIKAALARRY